MPTAFWMPLTSMSVAVEQSSTGMIPRSLAWAIALFISLIREPDGTQVDLDYESDANAYPVGMLGNVIQDTPTHYTRVKRVTITDRVTNQSGYTEFRYLAGHESRGEFLGYEFKDEDTYINGVLTKSERSGYDLETEFPPRSRVCGQDMMRICAPCPLSRRELALPRSSTWAPVGGVHSQNHGDYFRFR